MHGFRNRSFTTLFAGVRSDTRSGCFFCPKISRHSGFCSKMGAIYARGNKTPQTPDFLKIRPKPNLQRKIFIFS